MSMSSGAYMMRAFVTCLTFSISMVLITSCATDDIFKAFKIDYTPAQEKISDDQKIILDLKKQLAAAKEKEAVLSDQNGKLKKEIDEKETVLSDQIVQLKNEISQKETVLSDQIIQLKNEISEKEAMISIQGKVIGLLDDSEQTLQKSIEAQVKNN